MSLSKFALVVASLSVLAAPALSIPPLYGSWKGKVKLNLSKIPGGNDPKNKARFAQQSAAIQRTSVTLTLQKDHSFAMKISGSPVSAQNATRKGKWTLKGDQLTLIAEKTTTKPNPFTVAKDGKSFTVDVMNGMASLSFVR